MSVSKNPDIDIISFENSDDEYMLIQDIIAIYGSRVESNHIAKEMIGSALRAGDIECFAEHYWQTDRGDVVFDDWVPRRDAEGYLRDVILPAELFRSSKQWPEDFSLWKWHSSELVLFLEDDVAGSTVQRAHLSGARLLVEAVEALLPLNRTVNRRATNRSGVGGRPIRTHAWTAFWHAVLELAVDQRLADFDSQKELRDHILKNIGDALTEETIRTPVRQIWQKFVKKQEFKQP